MDEARLDEAPKAVGQGRLGRRGLIAGGIVAFGAAVFGRAKPAQATDGQALIVGEDNTATKPTLLESSSPGLGFAASAGGSVGIGVTETIGLLGVSDRLGVFGSAPFTLSPGITQTNTAGAAPPSRIGVLGSSPPTTLPELMAPVGVFGVSERIGVLGSSVPEADPALTMTVGVLGASNQIGVLGASPPVTVTPTDGPVGVGGIAGDPSGVGVRAENTGGGVGLDVLGQARFSTAGVGTIGAHTDSGTVSETSVAQDSVVMVTLMGSSKGSLVKWVERQPGKGFIVHLTSKTDSALPFSYLVVAPG